MARCIAPGARHLRAQAWFDQNLFSHPLWIFYFSEHCMLLVGNLYGLSLLHDDPRSISLYKTTDPGRGIRALFDSLSFFVTIWIIRRALASNKTSEYIFHLSLDFVIAVLATFWVLFVFTFGGWLISLWETAPEQLADRGTKYTNRAIQAIQDPTGRENAKNIYFGLIMGVSAALPTCLHIGLFFYSAIQQIIPSRKLIGSTAEKSPKQE